MQYLKCDHMKDSFLVSLKDVKTAFFETHNRIIDVLSTYNG
jgi:hypothetical protein